MRGSGGEARRAELAQLRRHGVASLLEGTTLLLLLGVAVLLKHLADLADAVRVVGPIHGIAFVAYGWLTVQMVAGGEWTRTDAARLCIGALLPFGGFLNAPFLARRMAALR